MVLCFPWELLLEGRGDMLGWLLTLKVAGGSDLLVHLLFHFFICFVAQHREENRARDTNMIFKTMAVPVWESELGKHSL